MPGSLSVKESLSHPETENTPAGSMDHYQGLSAGEPNASGSQSAAITTGPCATGSNVDTTGPGCGTGCCSDVLKQTSSPEEPISWASQGNSKESEFSDLNPTTEELGMGCNMACCGDAAKTLSTKQSGSLPSQRDDGTCSVDKDDGGCCSGGKLLNRGCCEASCLETIALQQCQEQCSKNMPKEACEGNSIGSCCQDNSYPSNGNPASTSVPANIPSDQFSNQAEISSACNYHSTTIRDRFAGRLDTLFCLCRKFSLQCRSPKCATKDSSELKKREAGSSAASTGISKEMWQYDSLRAHRKRLHPRMTVMSDRSSSNLRLGRNDSIRTTSRAVDPPTVQSKVSPSNVDLEKGVQYEAVLLSVRGMTCTGCQNILNRAINAIPGARKANSSIIQARAEFEIDTGCITVEDAIAALQRTTTFSYSRITEEKNQFIDVVVDDALLFSNQPLPKGILNITNLNDKVVRISYVAGETGVRDIVEKTFPQNLQLAPINIDPAVTAGRSEVWKHGILLILSATLTVPVLVLDWAPLPNTIAHRSVSLALATVVQLGVVWQFYPKAFSSLVHSRLLEVDALIVLSTTTAYVFSVAIFAFALVGRQIYDEEFFASSTLLVTLIFVGRFISELARQKSMELVSMRSLQSRTTTIYTNLERTATREIDVRLLQYGDVFRVSPGSRVATDGVVIFGGSEVDESMVTGESLPVAKAIESTVVAGSVNGSGTLDVSLTRLPHENTISTIAGLVDEAELKKPRSQAIADNFAGYFVPVVLVLTAIVFVIQFVVGFENRRLTRARAAVDAVTYAIAALIVSCPCAIGLAVPMVVVIANGASAKRGVVLKDPQMVEIARKTTHVVFDKTGTLTDDAMTIMTEQYFPEEDLQVERIRDLILSLVTGVNHPVSAAITHYLRAVCHATSDPSVKGTKVLPGKGVEGQYKKSPFRAGSPLWLHVSKLPAIVAIRKSNPHLTVIGVTHNSRLLAIFGLSNPLRSNALPVIQTLRSRNIKVSLVSGDDATTVEAVAAQLGIDQAQVRSRCSPQDKYDYISRIQQADAEAVVLFCGDGTNDAPALKAAQVGVHIASSSGTDIAGAAASVVLVRPDLRGLLVAIDISRSAFRRIVFNFAWSVLYNVIALTMAAGAWVEVRIPPAYAALGELVSVLPVIVIAWSLTWWVSFGKLKTAQGGTML